MKLKYLSKLKDSYRIEEIESDMNHERKKIKTNNEKLEKQFQLLAVILEEREVLKLENLKLEEEMKENENQSQQFNINTIIKHLVNF